MAADELQPGSWVMTPKGRGVLLRASWIGTVRLHGKRCWIREDFPLAQIRVLAPSDDESTRVMKLGGKYGVRPHMTEEQYEQWRDFAVRMARVCYGESKRPPGAWVLEWVDRLTDIIRHNGLEDVVDWDDNVSEEVDRLMEDEDPYFRGRIEEEETARACGGRDAWDVGDEVDWDAVESRIDDRDEQASFQWQRQWQGAVECCLRAGIDMVMEPGGGVVGFTVGDLRAMYPEGIPSWVLRHYQTDLTTVDNDTAVWL